MAWEEFVRRDKFEGFDRPFISFAPEHIAFNATFVRISGITSRHRVAMHVDSQNFLLGFEFRMDERPNSFKLSQACGSKKGEKRGGLVCAAQGFMNEYAWVKSITRLPLKDRRFYDPKKDGQKWIIQLCPTFEVKKARESSGIPSDAVGIYRYVRENGEIVYIGRGEIKKRLASLDRKEWDFDVIEYSIIANPDDQVEWEAYWLEKFQEANQKLPFYNKVSGFSKNLVEEPAQ